jgi:hypothetical protein
MPELGRYRHTADQPLAESDHFRPNVPVELPSRETDREVAVPALSA